MSTDSKHDANQLNEDVADLLSKKGTIEIIVEIGGKGPRRSIELRNTLSLSSSTIQQRLRDGKNQKVWTLTLEERDGNAAKVYQLTEFGHQIYEEAIELNLDELYREHRETVEKIASRKQELINP